MHKGPLSKLQEENCNKSIDSKIHPKPKVTAAVTKSEFIPVKDNIKETEKEKQFSIDNKNDIVDNKNEYNKINQEKTNVPSDLQIVPPKPLPRASRTGSICEPAEDVPPKPVARPRINSCVPVVTSVNPNVPIAGGYKVPHQTYHLFLYFYTFYIHHILKTLPHRQGISFRFKTNSNRKTAK